MINCGEMEKGNVIEAVPTGRETYPQRAVYPQVVKQRKNPAIKWMIAGLILFLIGYFLLLGSITYPVPPSEYSEESWEEYQNELEVSQGATYFWGIISFIGFLVFAISTIYGISWNGSWVHYHQ